MSWFEETFGEKKPPKKVRSIGNDEFENVQIDKGLWDDVPAELRNGVEALMNYALEQRVKIDGCIPQVGEKLVIQMRQVELGVKANGKTMSAGEAGDFEIEVRRVR